MYKVHFPVFGRQMRPGLWDRIPDDIWRPYSNIYLWIFSSVIQIVFSILYLVGWDFYFPSATERILWRSSAIYHCAFSLFGGIYILYNDIKLRKAGGLLETLEAQQTEVLQMRARHDVESPPAKAESATLRSGRIHKLWNTISRALEGWRNISRDQDPELRVRISSAWPIFGLTVIYIFCRAFIYIEDFISIRSQPQGVYITLNRFFPIPSL